MTAALPTRVQRAIEQQQYRSEIFVAAVQALVLAALWVMYLATPHGFSPDAPVKATSLGLSLFAILTGVRAYFAVTRQLTPLFLACAVVIEMSVLIVTLWATHLQFEASPTLYLKDPGLLYVFILLAMRSLRFEPVWVILSGATALIGWSILVLLALRYTHFAVTWDYLTYATTGNIHPASEFHKLLAIALVTALLALAVHRARLMLVQAIAQTQATKDLSSFFDEDVARQITQAENRLRAGDGVVRHAAILFTDLRGFTKAAAHLSPSELIGLIGEYQSLLVPIIRTHHGNIDKFMGDGILASFGAVTPSETYAADALRAVDAITEATAAWQQHRAARGLPSPGVGAAVASGPVVFGVIGDDKRLEYTVIGDAVNLAAKLEKHTKTEQVKALTTAAVLSMAAGQSYPLAHRKEVRHGRAVEGVKERLDLVVMA